MSISYEEALETLTSMFGEPWTQDDLDTVLRHYKGHMENTVDAVLSHGDGDPQALLKKLQSGGTPGGADTANDEALARQLAQEERLSGSRQARRSQPSTAPAPAPPSATATREGRGTPTDLPPDFLRVPGAPIPSSTSTMDSDEALARMLQDELFSQELANNPEFAHLARGRPRMVGGRPTSARSSRGHIGEMPRRSAGYPGNQSNRDEGPNILDKLSEMGDAAKHRLAAIAAQWNERNRSNTTTAMGSTRNVPQETRGLLDEDDDGEEMEMTFAGTGSKKNM